MNHHGKKTQIIAESTKKPLPFLSAHLRIEQAKMFALKDKYIDIFTNFGFKKLFGEEANKDILIDSFSEDSLKYYRDLNNVIDTAFDDGVKVGHETGLQEGVKLGHETGLQEGLQTGRQEGERQKALDIARNLIDVLDVKTIAQKTGLSEADILALKSE